MKVIHCHGLREDTETARYIGRPGPYGNPFVLDIEANREAILEKYRIWFLRKVDSSPEFRKRILSLRGFDLACWCAPRSCHGDVILKWLETHDE